MAGQGAWGKAGERAHDSGDDIFFYHGHRDFYGAAPVYRRAVPQVYHVGHGDGGAGGRDPYRHLYRIYQIGEPHGGHQAHLYVVGCRSSG